MENEAGPAFIAMRNTANSNGDQHESRPTYSIPGILHFIQHEWTRFEMERAQWEVERAELQARIAFLQGERRGQENLKKDLIRRIKMLEYALKQERQKFHKLKYGTDLKLPDIKDDIGDDGILDTANDVNKANVVSFNYRQGRQILRQYLQEIGYTDKVLELRSARVRVLLGLTGDDANAPSTESSSDVIPAPLDQLKHGRSDLPSNAQVLVDDVDDQLINEKPVPARRAPSPPLNAAKRHQMNGTTNPDDVSVENDESALDSFNFLQNEGHEDLEAIDEDIDDGGNADDELDEKDDEDTGKRNKGKTDVQNDIMEKLPPPEEALKDYDFFPSDEQRHLEEASGHIMGQKDSVGPSSDEWHVDQGKLQKLKEAYKKERKAVGRKDKRPNRSVLQSMIATLSGDEYIPPPPSVPAPPVPGFPSGRNTSSDLEDGVPPLGDVALPSSHFGSVPVRPGQLKQRATSPGSETMEVAIGLGDLAGLTVSNEAGPLSVDMSSKDEIRRTWTPKFTLRSHFDGVRSLAFHPYESALVTAGEDSTVKLWSLQRNTQMKKGSISDIEPVYTFRGHNGPVLSVVMNSNGNVCYSGSTDATIQCWNLPPLNLEPFGPYDPNIVGETLIAHTDCVWDLDVQSDTDRLLSCAADGTCRLWNPSMNSPLLCTYSTDNDIGNPTSVCFINTDPGQMVASYTTSQCVVYDLETAQPIVKLNSGGSYGITPATQINKVISHPTLPLLITAHEDRHIRVFDINSGEQIHTMVAHLDAVTCLSIDPTGLYLLSGSHDGSIRLWNMDNKTCIQEITAHRKKFDEAVFDVAFHSTQPLIASTGADAMAKVFV